MIWSLTSEISHHHKVAKITKSPTSLSAKLFAQTKLTIDRIGLVYLESKVKREFLYLKYLLQYLI